jgi:uncharacterized protein YtpQ (UPF0354 family)
LEQEEEQLEILPGILQCLVSFIIYYVQECMAMFSRNIIMDMYHFSWILPILAVSKNDSRFKMNDEEFPFDPGIFCA